MLCNECKPKNVPYLIFSSRKQNAVIVHIKKPMLHKKFREAGPKTKLLGAVPLGPTSTAPVSGADELQMTLMNVLDDQKLTWINQPL